MVCAVDPLHSRPGRKVGPLRRLMQQAWISALILPDMSRSRASILPFAPWPRFRVQKPCRGRPVCTPASAKFERSYPGISAPIGDSSRGIALLVLCQQPALRPTTCPPLPSGVLLTIPLRQAFISHSSAERPAPPSLMGPIICTSIAHTPAKTNMTERA